MTADAGAGRRVGNSGRRSAFRLRGALALVLAAVLASRCASRPVARHFTPAGPEQAARALAAWKTAVARADEMGPSRLLYDAKIRQGIASVSGTLAVKTATPIQATLSGPFGSILAEYSDGALRGEKLRPIEIAPEPLLWLLAGVWKSEDPNVEGFDGDEALLVWQDGIPAEGVIRVALARFTSIRARRPEGEIEATYSGTGDPWPDRLTLRDVRSGNSLRLLLQGRETLR